MPKEETAEEKSKQASISLRKRTLILLPAFFFLFFFLFYGAARVFILTDFLAIEEQNLHIHVDQAARVLEEDLTDLKGTIDDYIAALPITDYTVPEASEILMENSSDHIMNGFKINLVMYSEPDGILKFQKGYDIAEDVQINVDPILAESVFGEQALAQLDEGESHISELINFENKPTLVVVRKLNSSPGSGYFAMGRFLEETLLDVLVRSSGLPLSIIHINDINITEDFSVARTELLKNQDSVYLTDEIPPDYLSGYSIIHNSEGSSEFILRLDASRDALRNTEKVIFVFFFSFFFMGFIFEVAVVLFLKTRVFDRISRLKFYLDEVRETKDFSSRISVIGNDEISSLEGMTNRLLGSIEEGNRGLVKAGEESRQHSKELEQINRQMVGREMRMIELKKQIEELKKKSGIPSSRKDNSKLTKELLNDALAKQGVKPQPESD